MNNFIKKCLYIWIIFVLFVSCAPTANYALKDFGSFHVGGRQVTLSGLPVREIVFTKGAPPMRVDPNGDFEVDQMYVEYMIPADQKSIYPLLMWHGGGLTGVTWETKPDGKPGWMHYFLKAGHPVYVSDAVERGRASWARYPEIFASEPFFRTKKEAWELFRIGPKDSYNTDPQKRFAHPGQKFPIPAFDQFCKQGVPRWATNDAATQAAYNALIQKVGPCIVMVHNQGGNFGFNAALTAPDQVKAVIAIEPSGAPKSGPDLEKLKNIPILIVWGDYLDKQDLWQRIVPSIDAFAKDLRSKGGKVDWIELPKMGISGNTHMLMMDTNSNQVANVVQDWMTKNRLTK
jgi:pimeloyl-ACP methyl ester carboxylesterase